MHLEHCAPNSDCLVLIPRKAADASPARLLLAASAVRLERWRLFEKFKRVIEASLDPYRDDAEVAQLRGWSHGAN